mgnify:FL=1
MNHKVVIELEFNNIPAGRQVWDCDVYDYLEELIEDESLDYKVTDSNGQEYGVINWKKIVHRT